MKHLLIVAALFVLGMSSCSKDNNLLKGDCSCGEVVSDDNGYSNGQGWYSVDIKNNCTNNTKKFYLNQSDWMNAHVGEDFCITNEDSW